MLKLFWVIPASAVLLLAADPSWRSKPIPNWTESDAQEVLDQSPWTKIAKANLLRAQTEFERRDGGNMGQEHGVGFDGVEANKPRTKLPPSLFASPTDVRPMPKPVILTLRWESALPVRVAELKAHVVAPPTSAEEGYMLAVYGIPGKYFKEDPSALGAPLKKTAVLKRDGKKDVKPSSVEVFQRSDGLVAVYIFSPSAEISKNDGRLEFDATIGRLALVQYFEPAEMMFQGKLEL